MQPKQQPNKVWQRPSMVAPDHLMNVGLSLAGVNRLEGFKPEDPGLRNREMAHSRKRVRAIGGGKWQTTDGRVWDMQEKAVYRQIMYDGYTIPGGNAMSFAKRHPAPMKLRTWLVTLPNQDSCEILCELWPIAQQQLVKAGGLSLSMAQRRDKVLETIIMNHPNDKLPQSEVQRIAAEWWDVNRELSELKIMAKAYCEYFAVKKVILLEPPEEGSTAVASKSVTSTKATTIVTFEQRKEFMTSFAEWLQQSQTLSVKDAEAKMKAIMQGDLDEQVLDWIKNGKPSSSKEEQQQPQPTPALVARHSETEHPEHSQAHRQPQHYGQIYQQVQQDSQPYQQPGTSSTAQQIQPEYGGGYNYYQQPTFHQQPSISGQGYQSYQQPVQAHQQITDNAVAQPGYQQQQAGYAQPENQVYAQTPYQPPTQYAQQDWQVVSQPIPGPGDATTMHPVPTSPIRLTDAMCDEQLQHHHKEEVGVQGNKDEQLHTRSEELDGFMRQLQLSEQPQVEVYYPGYAYQVSSMNSNQQERGKSKKTR
ncbi:hypothetical protein EJ03DRAFT_352146 [Teratosphaeria nubilosa]|uniref:Uncharacterized protein n=1 Tax=Teratosphaeria nubilosa TaxID=161662 RepID=A0A6G1L657_9PEZI|nr:hypothetical protein EJ03DRAFT_352146 [Teratosphaeria nubilosa]